MKTLKNPISKEEHLEFWRKNPALLWGILLLVGSSSALFPGLLFCFLFFMIYLVFLKKWPLVIFLFISFLFGHYSVFSEKRVDSGYFSIQTLENHTSFFRTSLAYKGELYTGGGKIPCTVYHPISDKRPLANKNYFLLGTGKNFGGTRIVFRPQKWIPSRNTFQIAELRYQLKEKLRFFLKSNIKNEEAFCFFSGLITADIESKSLRYHFSKLGLSHLLAISGFHFGILLLFFSYLLDLVVKRKSKIFLLLLLIHSYLVFIGPMPAAERSCIAASLYLIARLIGKNPRALNLLGGALFIEVLCNPLISASIGFQLSFASCLGIFLFYKKIYEKLKGLTFSQSPSFPLQILAQKGSLFFMKALSLSLSVNILLFPLLLYHFHSVPLLSFLYNLLIPPLVTIVFFTLLISLTVQVIAPPLSPFFFYITELFAKEILELVYHPPASLTYSIQVSGLPSFLLILFFLKLVLIAPKIEGLREAKNRKSFLI